MPRAQILLVEDEGIVARDVQNRLKHLGYGVSGIAVSGEEALRKAAEMVPDLVLMDIVLKGEMDGVEACAQLRQRFNVPVIFLTAYADDPTMQRAKVAEPFGYLLKPYEERVLHTTIELALYRHRIERKLKETKQWLAATLQAIGDAVIATDARGCVLLINPAAECLLNCKAEQARGRALSEVFTLIDERTGGPANHPAARARRTGASVALPEHALLRTRDGGDTPIEGTVSPLEDSEGNFSGFVLAFRDLTQRRRHEAQQSRREAFQHQFQKMEAISRLAGGMAHDFNNLLTTILGNTALIAEGLPPDDPQLPRVEAVEQAALDTATLVQQLLGYARQTPLRLACIDLNRSLDDALGMLRLTADARIDQQREVAADLWPVQADSTQFHHVLLNLLRNACEAMPEGGRLHLRTENVVHDQEHLCLNPQAPHGEYVRLGIRDTGSGIAPTIRPHIFEPFFTTKHPGQGRGLGLTMVHGIISQLHGWVECNHDVFPGTEFIVYLPRYCPAPSGPPVLTRPQKHAGRETILVADDESTIRDLARLVLETEGYQVLQASDGVQAVELFQQQRQRIDLVILDVNMPRLSGSDAYGKLLALDPEIHVLFSSGYAAQDVSLTNAARVLGFLGKPYRPAELLQTVRSALKRAREIK